MPSICLNKDIFASKLRVLRDGKLTRGIQMSLFMQGAYQMDREMFDAEVMLNDSCQVMLLLVFVLILICFNSIYRIHLRMLWVQLEHPQVCTISRKSWASWPWAMKAFYQWEIWVNKTITIITLSLSAW